MAEIRTLDQLRNAQLGTPRVTTMLLGIFAFVALFITAVGVSGTLALSVARRSKEIGIRIALGATKENILRDVLRQGLMPVLVGLLPGLASAAYKGVLLSTNAQPGWKDARWLGGYLTNSALLMGCAELLAVSALLGQTQATVILRTAVMVLVVVNVIPLALLFRNLRPAHALLYTRGQQWRVGALIAAGTLIPLCLIVLNRGLVLLLVAVIVLLAQSWLIRAVYVKIPHTAPLEVRSGS